MKPNFALTLSMDSIGLLHRAQQGWHFVSEVAPDSANLTRELQALRDKAMALDATGLRSKLVIPNEQIKYLTFDAQGAEGDDLAQAVRTALEGATPYALEDLSYDWWVGAGQVQVAAVARETLAEAEAFAVDHGFNPLSFVAIPENGDFIGEPFLGETAHVATYLTDGQEVERDNIAIRIFGTARVPETTAAPTSEPDLEPPAEEIVPDPEPTTDQIAQASDAATDPPLPSEHDEAESKTPATNPQASAAFKSIRAMRGVVPPTSLVMTGTAPDLAPLAKRIDAKAVSATSAPVIPARPLLTSAKVTMRPEAQAVDIDRSQTRGKPLHLGLILTVLLLLVMAGVAAWASLFLDDGLAGLFPRSQDPQTAAIPDKPAPQPADDPEDTTAPRIVVEPPDTTEPQDTTASPTPQPEILPEELTPDQAQARYAATGIWQMAPAPPQVPGQSSADDLYQTSIDHSVTSFDAVALPRAADALTDTRPSTPASPTAPGTRFQFDARGLIAATAAGALTPEGVRVFAGRPSVTPPPTPERTAPEDSAETVTTALRVATMRPRLRPNDLAEQNERSTLNGRSRLELAALRPRLRPEWAQVTAVQPAADANAINAALAEAASSPDADTFAAAAPQAVASSLKPRLRPREINQSAAARPQSQPSTETVAAVTVAPSIPSSASVARQATQKNVLKLNKVNLIGIYGTSNSRRALVRLPNGRYKKVQVGDRLDGGNVSAIGAQELRYIKRGRNVVLRMPNS